MAIRKQSKPLLIFRIFCPFCRNEVFRAGTNPVNYRRASVFPRGRTRTSKKPTRKRRADSRATKPRMRTRTMTATTMTSPNRWYNVGSYVYPRVVVTSPHEAPELGNNGFTSPLKYPIISSTGLLAIHRRPFRPDFRLRERAHQQRWNRRKRRTQLALRRCASNRVRCIVSRFGTAADPIRRSRIIERSGEWGITCQ